MGRLIILAVSMVLAGAGAVWATPGDLRAIHGTVIDIPQDAFLVLRGDGGHVYYTDISEADRGTATQQIKRNARVTVIGAEGARPDELKAYIIDDFKQANVTAGPHAADSPTTFRRVKGVVEQVNGQQAKVKSDDGRSLTIDLQRVDPKLRSSVAVGRHVLFVGRYPAADRAVFVARFAGPADAPAFSAAEDAPQGANPSRWRRLHGTVESVQGETLTLRTDRGRTRSIDMSAVAANVRGALTPGEKVTVAGFPQGQGAFQAQYIQQDSSDPSRGGAVVGQTPAPVTPAPAPGPTSSGPVDQNAWQRVHGTVHSITGNKVTMKADDGRMVTVDVAQVGDSVRKALTPGEGITVAGFFQGNQQTMVARFIQQDSSAPAASPTTK